MVTVFDGQGKPVILGPEVGKGGEGSVYEVAHSSDIVAKIYHKPLDAAKSAKIEAMAALYSDQLCKVAAWPISSLRTASGGNVCGLLMPRVSKLRQVHELYGPKSRLTFFPNANWAFLIHTAMNTARAFAVLHKQNLVIGDVNQSNLLVSEQATVALIDCDSFQISYQGQSFLCEVGVPTHTPPELQGKAFRSVLRTPNHDNFGLAVVVFQLLFMGRHPFSGQYLGIGEMPIEKAISEFRFAYGPGAAAYQMKPPPATLPFASVSTPVGQLFERAFSSVAVKPNIRPRAEEWVAALTSLEQHLKACDRHSGHQYLYSLSSCPFCDLELNPGLILFHVSLAGGSNSSLDVEIVWTQISSVSHPGPLPFPALPSFSLLPPFSPSKPMPPLVKPLAKTILATNMLLVSKERASRRWRVAAIVAVVGAFANPFNHLLVALYLMTLAFVFAYTFILATFNRKVKIQLDAEMKTVNDRYQTQAAIRSREEKAKSEKIEMYLSERNKLEAALSLAEKNYEGVRKQWESETSSQPFDTRLAELENARKQLQELAVTLPTRYKKLEQEGEKRQRETYLDRFKIQAAYIDGIGQGRKATLQSYGVETAGDITESRILNIPGFGPSLSYALLTWRRGHEARFVYNPALGVSAADKSNLDREFAARRIKPEHELRTGLSSLMTISQQISEKRIRLRAELEPLRQAVFTARSNYRMLKPEP